MTVEPLTGSLSHTKEEPHKEENSWQSRTRKRKKVLDAHKAEKGDSTLIRRRKAAQ